jgi:competence protein ComEA
MTQKIVTACCLALGLAAALPVKAASALPDGSGKDLTVQICGKCHSPERVASLHQSRRGWAMTIARMVNMGAGGTDEQLNSILDYLATNFPPPPPAPININTATPVQLESSLVLLRTEAAAVIQYRKQHGNFKSLDDLRKVPGLDFQKIEKEKSRIVF